MKTSTANQVTTSMATMTAHNNVTASMSATSAHSKTKTAMPTTSARNKAISAMKTIVTRNDSSSNYTDKYNNDAHGSTDGKVEHTSDIFWLQTLLLQ